MGMVVEQEGRDDNGEREGFFLFLFFINYFIFKTRLMPRILVNKLSQDTILLDEKITKYC